MMMQTATMPKQPHTQQFGAFFDSSSKSNTRSRTARAGQLCTSAFGQPLPPARVYDDGRGHVWVADSYF